ncbi:MAG: MBL fold metallo-hydrolase, partial [Acidobacteria bacterium]|nr:MBL fold metallo-hydrolase [Acidobacteriota bacterium]
VLAWPVEILSRLPAHPAITLPWPAGTSYTLAISVSLWAGLRWPGRVGAPLVLAAMLILRLGGSAPDPELVLFDVGQGESILLRSAGRTLLIDGGGSPGGGVGDRVLLPALARLGVRHLDAVAVTHPDTDHCRGLEELADYLPVGQVRTPPRFRQAECVAALERDRGISWLGLAQGEVVIVGEWRIEVLHPPEEARDLGENDGSL